METKRDDHERRGARRGSAIRSRPERRIRDYLERAERAEGRAQTASFEIRQMWLEVAFRWRNVADAYRSLLEL